MYAEIDVDLPSHPKSLRLAALLNEPRAWTRMVELWLWALRYALDGDLSKFTDQEVAQAMGYNLNADPASKGALKNILVSAGFLDESFQLHDWKDRNNTLKKKRLAMRKLRAKRGARVTPVLPPRGAMLPLNGTEQNGSEREQNRTETSPPIPPVGGGEFESWYSEYPKKKNRGDAERAWEKLRRSKALPPVEALLESIRRLKRSEDWRKDGGKWIPYPASWLNAKGWLDETEEDTEDIPESLEAFAKARGVDIRAVD